MKDIHKSMGMWIALIIAPFMAAAKPSSKVSFEDWLIAQKRISTEKLIRNISPSDARPGAVIASPSRHDPDYYYHWVRDAALVMEVVRQLSMREPELYNYRKMLQNFIEFSLVNQQQKSTVGFGEPKYYVDGSAYLGPWGRPQNDGPALRALALMRWTHLMRAPSIYFLLRQQAWDVIAADLDYVVSHWRQPSFDLWEEFKGDNFYTKLVQKAALQKGAEVAEAFGDLQRARIYRAESAALSQSIEYHYSEVFGYIIENMNHVEGIFYKSSGLDTGSLLGVLHTEAENIVSIDDARLAKTIAEYERVFGGLYWINRKKGSMAPAIGRYPEDKYYGGNPWFLTTAALAEYYYLLASQRRTTGVSVKYVKALIARGDLYLKRFRYHVDEFGSVSEQMDRHSGYMTSARDLTWSYASFLTAVWARERALDAQTRR